MRKVTRNVMRKSDEDWVRKSMGIELKAEDKVGRPRTWLYLLNRLPGRLGQPP